MNAPIAQRPAQLAASIAQAPTAALAPFTPREWLSMNAYSEAFTSCLRWPRIGHPEPAAGRAPPLVPANLPVLVINGDLDSWTPASDAPGVVKQIGPSARLVVLKNAVHTATEGDLLTTVATRCGRSLVRAFVAAPQRLATLDTSCADSVPPIHTPGAFPVKLAGAAPATVTSGAASASARQAATVAAEALGDATQTWWSESGDASSGLYGGRFRGTQDGETVSLALRGVRFVTDAQVSGTGSLGARVGPGVGDGHRAQRRWPAADVHGQLLAGDAARHRHHRRGDADAAGAVTPAEHARRERLARACLLPGYAAADARAAARTVVGIQAQDVRASGLALRSRVPGFTRGDLDDPGLVRTWTVRGTVHLIDADDRDWLHAALVRRNHRTFDAIMRRRQVLAVAESMLPEMLAVLADGPRDRASLLAAVGDHGDLGPAIGILVPWAATEGRIVCLPDGRLRAVDRPREIPEEEALATLARRYLEGYGPASAEDLAAWSGLALGVARGALAAIEPPLPIPAEELAAPAPVQLLAAFDTSMLGHRQRDWILPAEHNHKLVHGGGMLRPVVLVRGVAAGFWRLQGSGRKRTIEFEWFVRPAPARPLAAEIAALAGYLGVELTA